MKRKQLLALLMAGIMSMSVMLAGCGGQGEGQDNTSAGGTSTEVVVEPTDNKLVIMMGSNTNVTDYDDNNLTKHFEDKLGIDIEFLLVPGTELLTKLSLMATSGEELPDIVLASSLSDEAIYNYGMEDVFLNVTEYLTDATAMPNFYTIPEEDRAEMLAAATMADGEMYGFPYSVENPWSLTPYRYYINQTWLDELGLPVPTTTDELKNVLIAFRDKDPNGNGIKDEIPLYGKCSGYSYGGNIMWALMNSFTFYNDGTVNCGLAVDENDTIYAPYVTEEWKQGLLYMKDLYDEGLIAPSAFTDDDTQFKAILNAETNIVGCVAAGSYGNWADTANNANFRDMTMIEPFTGPEGVCYTPYFPYIPNVRGFIFSDSDKVDLAIKFFDECYNNETALIARYGIEGEHWTVDPTELETLENAFIRSGLYEKASVVLYNNIWSTAENMTWKDVTPRYQSVDDVVTVVDVTNGREFNEDAPINLQAYNMEHYIGKYPEKVLPKLKYTTEETEQILDAITNIKSFIDQTTAEFITGERDIESGWEQYIDELNSMGLEEYIKVAQQSYNRTLK